MELYTAVKKTATDFFVEPGVSVKIPFIVEQCLTYLSEDSGFFICSYFFRFFFSGYSQGLSA